MEILIISGISGAGKSRAAAVLEDMDFYCVDNMPTELMPRFAELCLATKGRYERVALVADVRGVSQFEELFYALDEMEKMGCEYKILYLDASAEVLVQRYKETRRKHPLDPDGGNLKDSILKEQEMLKPVKERADYIIDTSNLTVARLQQRLSDIFTSEGNLQRFNVNIMSFGYKYGIPTDADVVFDVRFLANPYYVTDLREKNGLDKAVSDYVFDDPRSGELVEKIISLLTFLIPNYMEEGKTSAVICIGCTGGQHRSVAVAEAIGRELRKLNYPTECKHRDITK